MNFTDGAEAMNQLVLGFLVILCLAFVLKNSDDNPSQNPKEGQ